MITWIQQQPPQAWQRELPAMRAKQHAADVQRVAVENGARSVYDSCHNVALRRAAFELSSGADLPQQVRDVQRELREQCTLVSTRGGGATLDLECVVIRVDAKRAVGGWRATGDKALVRYYDTEKLFATEDDVAVAVAVFPKLVYCAESAPSLTRPLVTRVPVPRMPMYKFDSDGRQLLDDADASLEQFAEMVRLTPSVEQWRRFMIDHERIVSHAAAAAAAIDDAADADLYVVDMSLQAGVSKGERVKLVYQGSDYTLYKSTLAAYLLQAASNGLAHTPPQSALRDLFTHDVAGA
jgi:hypothetical protein